MKSCVTCRFAEPTLSDSGEPYTQCRRFPPSVIVLDDGPLRAYPSVDEDDWCGEHEPESDG